MKTANIEVTYLNHMGSDLAVVNAARVSFQKESDWVRSTIPPNSFSLSEADRKLIKYLADHEHWSPFAHCSVSFRVKAPIFIARQLVKHTVGFAWNEVSRRYVDEEPEFYFPQYWRARADNVKQGSRDEPVKEFRVTTGWEKDKAGEPVANAFEYYPGIYFTLDDQIKWHCRDALIQYKDLLASGVCPEQARMVLPQNTMTEWIWTGSLYAWARMCHLRLDSHTQKETQEVAKLVDVKMDQLFPVSWAALKKDGK